MKRRTEKLCDLKEAAAYIKDGMRIAFGGFVLYQKPMALVHELIRAGRKDLTIVGSANSIDVDMLVGAGALSRIETSYVGLEKFGLAKNFRRAMEQGRLKTVYYPELVSWDRFRASREGLAFWPVNSLGGSDIVNKNPDIVPFPCPITGRPLWAVPAANIDVGIIHAHAADKYGNVQIQERHMVPQGFNLAVAGACKTLIVLAEKIVSNEEIRKHAQYTAIPAFKTTCVVHVPFGSHPTPTLSVTRMDNAFFNLYVKASETDESFRQFLDRYVYGVGSFDEYLDAVGRDQVEALREQ